MRYLGVLPGGRKWEYDISLPPAGGSNVVVLANPLLADYNVWDDVVDELLAAGFRVLRFNMYGQGATECPTNPDRWTLTGLAQDFWRMFDFTAVSKNGFNFPVYAWIGAGLGGALGVQFATTHVYAVRNIVLINTPPCSPSLVPGHAFPPPSCNPSFSASVPCTAVEALAVASAHTSPENVETAAETCFHAWFSSNWRADPSNTTVATRVRKSMSSTSPQGLQAALAMLSGPEFDLRTRALRLASFVKRVRFIVGAEDEQTGPRVELLRRYVEDGFAQRDRLLFLGYDPITAPPGTVSPPRCWMVCVNVPVDVRADGVLTTATPATSKPTFVTPMATPTPIAVSTLPTATTELRLGPATKAVITSTPTMDYPDPER